MKKILHLTVRVVLLYALPIVCALYLGGEAKAKDVPLSQKKPPAQVAFSAGNTRVTLLLRESARPDVASNLIRTSAIYLEEVKCSVECSVASQEQAKKKILDFSKERGYTVFDVRFFVRPEEK